MSILDFELIRILGQGSTGIVWHARRLQNNQECAVKMLDKQQIATSHSATRVVAEREILTMLDHPFVVQLHFAFQDATKVYFVMDYAAGGDFYNFLRQFPQRRMEESTARFFVAELILAFEYLHAYDISFRDLKPENLLLSKSGHLMVTDFGLSVRSEKGQANGECGGGQRTVCGTPEYMAPEVIKENGHGKAVDCWALGLILYELLHGRSPWWVTVIHIYIPVTDI
jgi:protein-serine/threonine kinase